MSRTGSDVLIIGAGAIGSAIAYFCSREGLRVRVVDAGAPGGGASSRCEGNILVSDKEHGPELDLAKFSLSIFKGELAEFGQLFEFEDKGGIIVASRPSSMSALQRALAVQRQHGIEVEEIDVDTLRSLEPYTTDDAVGAAFYPEDSQVMPMKVVNHLLDMARSHGASIHPYTPVDAFLRQDHRVVGIQSGQQCFYADIVINAAGPWSGQVAALANVDIPVEPRRGYVMVTEPLPPRVRHKVYAAEYIDNVGSSDGGLQCSPVVEGTPAGTILIGSSRERVGFSSELNRQALTTMAENAIALFPFLRDVRILRYYYGFRPYSPDHTPIIGPDSRAPGLWHACGHEGAGIGLSAGTGKIVAQAITGAATELDLAAFSPDRFSSSSSSTTAAG